MTVGIVGREAHAAERIAVVQGRAEARLVRRPAEAVDLFAAAQEEHPAHKTLKAFFDEVEVAFIAVPTAARFQVAEAAMRQGAHVFLEWPPATSIREGEMLLELAEEAGVEIGVSRPLRFHPAFEAFSGDVRRSLILVQQVLPRVQRTDWTARLAETVDLCCALAQSSSVQRVDAEAAHESGARLEAAAFGLRFHNGAYAQVSLRQQVDGEVEEAALYVAGTDFQLKGSLEEGALYVRQRGEPVALPEQAKPGGLKRALRRETEAFLDAVVGDQPAPVSVLDGLHTMRLVERLMQKLR